MNNIVDVTLENAQQVLIEASQQKLVMVDFWADWCEPCKQLMPVLEKIANEFAEQLLLAKVNCDEQQAIAMQFGVKNLPTVALLKDGQPIDGFAGVIPESEIRELLQKHLPKQQDEWFQQGVNFAEQEDWNQAYPLLLQAHQAEPENALFKKVLTKVCLELGKIEDAELLLGSIAMVDQDSAYQQLVAKLDLAKQASESPEIVALQGLLQKDPSSLEVKLKLGVALSQANKKNEALELIFEVLKVDLGFEDAKKTYLDIIASFPEGDQAASQYRRKLYTLLY